MMLTDIGRFLRNLRLDNQELLYDMAIKLGISSAQLSSIETGKKKLRDIEFNKVVRLYGLSKLQINELEKLISKAD